MLYTTYFNKINKLPENTKKLIITRFPPKWFDIKKYPDTFLVKEFAPYKETLLDYKKNNDWNKYVERFSNQIINDKTMQIYLSKLKSKLLEGYDYALICYEKDCKYCHRYLIARYLEKEYGVEWKEL